MLIYDIPIELLHLILLYTIHPDNNYYYLLLMICRNKTIKNTILEINEKIMKCSICKSYICGDGIYCSKYNKPICNIHILYCNNCDNIVDIYQYSILFGKCMVCARYNKIVN